jgi:hypothetical protein
MKKKRMIFFRFFFYFLLTKKFVDRMEFVNTLSFKIPLKLKVRRVDGVPSFGQDGLVLVELVQDVDLIPIILAWRFPNLASQLQMEAAVVDDFLYNDFIHMQVFGVEVAWKKTVASLVATCATLATDYDFWLFFEQETEDYVQSHFLPTPALDFYVHFGLRPFAPWVESDVLSGSLTDVAEAADLTWRADCRDAPFSFILDIWQDKRIVVVDERQLHLSLSCWVSCKAPETFIKLASEGLDLGMLSVTLKLLFY